jgi:replicative DNA helicase
MGQLDLSLLSFLITQRPPAALVKSLRGDLHFEDTRVGSLVDFICDQIPSENEVPAPVTLLYMTHDKEHTDVIKECIGTEAVASNLNDYCFLFHKRETERRQETLKKDMSEALERGNHKVVMSTAKKLAAISNDDHHRIGPVDTEEFADISALSQPTKYISTHFHRLNQHLAGEPEGIEYEKTGGLTIGEITAIAGSVNRGKSTIAFSCFKGFIDRSAEDDYYKACYFNYEGVFNRFRQALFSAVTGVNPEIRNTSTYQRAVQEYQEYISRRQDKFIVYDAHGRRDMPYTVEALELQISQHAEEGFKVFIVDAINSINVGTKSDKENWSAHQQAMDMLERLATYYELAIIITVQNDRALEKQEDKWPGLHWISSSQEIQRRIGCGLGIYRTDMLCLAPYSELAIIKRRGDRGPYPKESVKVAYDKNRRIYTSYTGPETNIIDASGTVQKRQIKAAHTKSDIAVAYGQV